MSQLCCTRITLVLLLSHLCCNHVIRVALVSHSCRSCLTRIARVWLQNDQIIGAKYLFFIKVDAANVLLKLNHEVE